MAEYCVLLLCCICARCMSSNNLESVRVYLTMDSIGDLAGGDDTERVRETERGKGVKCIENRPLLRKIEYDLIWANRRIIHFTCI